MSLMDDFALGFKDVYKKGKKVRAKVSRGIPWTFLTFFLFMGLKLSHQIDWSWWWVTCPLWLGLALCAGVFAAFLAIGMVLVLGACLYFICEELWYGGTRLYRNRSKKEPK